MKDLVICGCDKICWLSLPEETEALARMLITMTIQAVLHGRTADKRPDSGDPAVLA